MQQFIEGNLWNEAIVINSNTNIGELLTENRQQDYIKAPTITGNLVSTIQLEDDIIQILKNPNAVFTA